jgi:hypothetical protein
VEQFASEAAMRSAYPGIEGYSRWMMPLRLLRQAGERFVGEFAAKGLMSTGHIVVYDEQMRPVGRADPDMLLGVLEVELKNGRTILLPLSHAQQPATLGQQSTSQNPATMTKEEIYVTRYYPVATRCGTRCSGWIRW